MFTGLIGLFGLPSDIVVDDRVIFRIRTRQERVDCPEAPSCDQENAIAVQETSVGRRGYLNGYVIWKEQQ
ncbi:MULTISPECIES: hypothetical protein [unclassified Bradyrhizobium]|uniref:hypothetical protein n=1 Tax=unclassified Bradyrhizobium TaxID=2631580 RepID=UPI0033932414